MDEAMPSIGLDYSTKAGSSLICFPKFHRSLYLLKPPSQVFLSSSYVAYCSRFFSSSLCFSDLEDPLCSQPNYILLATAMPSDKPFFFQHFSPTENENVPFSSLYSSLYC